LKTRRSSRSDSVSRIYLFGIGDVGFDILRKVSAFLSCHCAGLEVAVEVLENPAHAYNPDRNQYDAKLILADLERRLPNDGIRAIGITWADLYLPMLRYVYGSAQVEGRCAVFSLHRLHPRFYIKDEADHETLFTCRVEKTALHEIAHIFGLTHCISPDCVMYSSCRIEDTDCKSSEFCPSCRELFKWMVERAAGSAKSKA